MLKYQYGCIYVGTCGTNGKQYVGQTIERNPYNRIDSHFKDANSKKHNYPLHNAIRKYGRESFTFEIIFYAENQSSLDDAEDEFITIFDTLLPNGYNIRRGGAKGKHHLSTIQKMSDVARLTSADRSTSTKKAWANPDAKQRRSNNIRSALAKPEIKERHVSGIRIARLRPGVEEKRLVALREALTRPEQRAAKRIIALECMSRPEVKEKLRLARERNKSNEELLKKFEEGTRNSWKDPVVRKARSDGIRASKKGMKWITNENDIRCLLPDQSLPDGWRYGRPPRRRKLDGNSIDS
jgi:group I intron endonuclease